MIISSKEKAIGYFILSILSISILANGYFIIGKFSNKQVEKENVNYYSFLDKSEQGSSKNFQSCMIESKNNCENKNIQIDIISNLNNSEKLENTNDICKNINGEKEKTKCFDDYYYNLSSISNDIKVSKENCLKIVDSDIKNRCTNLTILKEINSPDNKESYLKNYNSCNGIKNDQKLKENCKYDITLGEIIKEYSNAKKTTVYASIDTGEEVDITDIEKINEKYLIISIEKQKKMKALKQKEYDSELSRIQSKEMDENQRKIELQKIIDYYTKNNDNYEFIETKVKKINYNKLKKVDYQLNLSLCNKLGKSEVIEKCKTESIKIKEIK